jgi:polysaccharide export outer membrane protein
MQYVIGAGDTLDIIVWGEDKVSGRVEVRPDGMITVPLIGDIAAAGLTPEQLAESLRQGLTRYIDSPNVVVRVGIMGSRRFFVIGNVRTPGMFDMRPEQTFLQAIAVAGGFTDFANRNGVRIVRKGGGGPPVEPNYDAITRGEVPDVRIEPNDTIIVP